MRRHKWKKLFSDLVLKPGFLVETDIYSQKFNVTIIEVFCSMAIHTERGAAQNLVAVQN